MGSLRGHSGPNGASVLAKDLTSLSDLLATTNNVLHRNSHLRASLTISVKKPSLSRTGSNAAKATSTPKNVRKTPAKSKPSKEKMQKGCVKAEKNLKPCFATLTKDNVGNTHLSFPCLHGMLPVISVVLQLSVLLIAKMFLLNNSCHFLDAALHLQSSFQKEGWSSHT